MRLQLHLSPGLAGCGFILGIFCSAPSGSQARNFTRYDTKCNGQGCNSSNCKDGTQNKVQRTSINNGNINVAAIAGSKINLICTNNSCENLISVIWKIKPKTGQHCTLAYRTDQNQTQRINCSENVDWKSSPDIDNTLQIQKLSLTDEGTFICETAKNDGTFIQNYSLTVFVPPEVTLTCDSEGSVVCEAAAGKPAGQIFWDPSGDSKNETKDHLNGTVTVRSTYILKVTNVTCMVSHPAWNKSKIITCQPGLPSSTRTIWLCALSAGLLGIIFFLASIFLCRLHHGRLDSKSKRPETAATHNVQDNNEQQELEPYASYVQKENTIYSTAFEVVECESPPHQGAS